MRIPEIEGTIERRLLVNYRVDPEVVARLLPEPFRPQVVGDAAVAGICMIRLGDLRPRWAPRHLGLRSENAAHRIAVEWDADDGPRTGVYIPRRDTDSWITLLLGGRVYPGEHHRATFRVAETDRRLRVGYRAVDGTAEVEVEVALSDRLEGSTLFADVDAASAFFETGAVGWSATRDPGRLDGLELATSAWAVEPATVPLARSTFFEDTATFPPGTAELDCALVMRRVPVVWRSLDPLHAPGESDRPPVPG